MTESKIDIAELTKKFDLTGHSLFSPSSSAMWTTCSGSLLANIGKPDTSGVDAAWGTVAHGIAEDWLKWDKPQHHRIGTFEQVDKGGETIDIEVTYEMIDTVESYVNWVAYLPGDKYIETKVDFSDLTPIQNQRGTCDFAACRPNHLLVCDFKGGQGVPVHAENNTQALMYAYGFFKEYDQFYDFQEIEIRICQPRLDIYDIWIITREELLNWASWIKERAHEAWNPVACRTPSEKGCQWCKVKSECPALATLVHRLVDDVFDDLTISNEDMQKTMDGLENETIDFTPLSIDSLTVKHKAKLAKFRKMVEKWFAAIDDDLEARARNGEHIPGFKLVEGRSDRQFSRSDDTVVWYLTDMGVPEENLFKKKIIGITAVEEEFRKLGHPRKALPNLLKPIVVKPTGRPTLVSEDDKRPAIDGSRDDGIFGDLTDDDL